MHNDAAFVLTILVLCYAVVSGLVKRWYVAPALIFVAAGMILGSSGLWSSWTTTPRGSRSSRNWR
jgi:NhaP-type Na+/H+ and K+/H+ antiporter